MCSRLSFLLLSAICIGDALVTLRSSSLSLQQKAVEDADREFDRFLEEWFDDFLARKPMEALRFGRSLPACSGLAAMNRSHVHQIWGDASGIAETQGIKVEEQWMHTMVQRFGATIGKRSLSDERHASYVLMQKKVAEMRQENMYSVFRPPFGPLGCQVGVMGCQVQCPNMVKGLLINNADDARCYVALLNGLPDFLLAHGRRLEDAVLAGTSPYRLVLEAVVLDCDAKIPAEQNLSNSQMLSQLARSNEFFETFLSKLQTVTGISEDEKQLLLHVAEKSIVDGVWPAYGGLRKVVSELLPKTVTAEKGLVATHGASAEEFYAYRVKLLGVGGNTASLHERAMQLVNKNAEEIQRAAVVVFPSLTETSPTLVSEALRRLDSEARFLNTEDGRALYIHDVNKYIEDMSTRLRKSATSQHGRLFFESDLPAISCLVKRMDWASFPGLAQYIPGRIGTTNYSAVVDFNTHDMSKVSKLDMEVLAYHEVVPGHHLQVTKTSTLPLPSWRRFLGDEAFAEGWAVYAEQDLSSRLVNLSTQSQLGRLNMLQKKAVRMAVDTGLHGLSWGRKKAEDFYVEHTTLTPENAKQAVDRHFAWPSQALNYAAGYEELRRVRGVLASNPTLLKALGKDWEAMLHKAILSHGDLPLSMLEEVVIEQLSSWSAVAPSPSSTHMPAVSLSVLLICISCVKLFAF